MAYLGKLLYTAEVEDDLSIVATAAPTFNDLVAGLEVEVAQSEVVNVESKVSVSA